MHTLLFIDTETGGLDPTAHSILSLGAVLWRDGSIVDTLELFIAEETSVVDQEAMAVNAIDLRWLRAHGVRPTEAVVRFQRFLEQHTPRAIPSKQVLAGHNVAFDVAFLRRLYKLAGQERSWSFSHRLLDTASIVQYLIVAGLLPLQGASSDEVFRYFGIELERGKRHTALGDARATVILFEKLLLVLRTAP
jgi:DNA polymerase III epsilon subunit-like protein